MCINVWDLRPEIWTLLHRQWGNSSKHCRLTLADWIYILQTDTRTQKTHTETQETGTGLDLWRNSSRWMQWDVNTWQWWSDEDEPDSYINTGQAFMLNNGSSFRCSIHCPTISFCRQTHTAANISDGTNKRNPELTEWHSGMQIEAELIQ